MSITAASATAAFSADELIVEDSASRQYRLTTFNKSVNLAMTGAGGMDTGAAPVMGFVALYAIYNPTTDTSALLAVNATSALVPDVYDGNNMPSDYTASALVSVWPITSSQFVHGIQVDRVVSFVRAIAATTTTQISNFTALSLSSVIPMNARACSGYIGVTGINTTNAVTSVASTSYGAGQQQAGGNSTTGNIQNVSASPFSDLKITGNQAIYWFSSVASGSFSSGTVSISSYEF
ncbi:phage tail protein [Escherichia coli]|nr:phage tail protein [Escherichia coli]